MTARPYIQLDVGGPKVYGVGVMRTVIVDGVATPVEWTTPLVHLDYEEYEERNRQKFHLWTAHGGNIHTVVSTVITHDVDADRVFPTTGYNRTKPISLHRSFPTNLEGTLLRVTQTPTVVGFTAEGLETTFPGAPPVNEDFVIKGQVYIESFAWNTWDRSGPGMDINKMNEQNRKEREEAERETAERKLELESAEDVVVEEWLGQKAAEAAPYVAGALILITKTVGESLAAMVRGETPGRTDNRHNCHRWPGITPPITLLR